MMVDLNISNILNVILSSGFVGMIGLIIRLQLQLTRAENDIKHLTKTIEELKDIINKCILTKKL